MKKRIQIIPVILSLLLWIACSDGSKNQSVEIDTPEEIQQAKEEAPDMADVSFEDGMTGKVFHNYLQLKMALVNSDLSAAKTASGNMAESFSAERQELKHLAQQMAEAADIEQLRETFSTFTGKVEPLFKESLSEGTIYIQYCPMAFDNAGAYWFSDVREIRNPYFGSKMLTCGEVAETIQ